MAVVFIKIVDAQEQPHIVRLDAIKDFSYTQEDNTLDVIVEGKPIPITIGDGYNAFTLFSNLFALEQSIVDLSELIGLNDNLATIVAKQNEVDGDNPLMKVLRNVDESLKHLDIIAERRKQEKEMVKKMEGQLSLDFDPTSKLN